MARKPKLPFELTPLICRYLRDIQFGQEDRENPNVQVEPKDSFLITTWRSKEDYDSDYEQNLKDFKAFLVKNKMAKFPTFEAYEKKLGIKFSIESRIESLHNPDTNETYIFEKMFPVSSVDSKKVKAFREKYCKVSKPKIEKKSHRTDYRQKTKVLTKQGLPDHEFSKDAVRQETKTLRIFEELWLTRKHIVGGKQYRKGEPSRFDHFAVKVGLVSNTLAVAPRTGRAKRASVKKQIENVGANLRREGFSIKISCARNEVLMTVID